MTPAFEELFMKLIEKKSRFSAKHAVLSLIAASLALLISAALASASSLSSGQNKDGKPDFTGKWKAESLTKEAGEPPILPGTEKEMNEVDHKDPELKLIRSFEERPGVIEVRCAIDGKEGTITESNGYTGKSKAG